MIKAIQGLLLILLTTITLHAQPELGYCEQQIDETAQKQIPRAMKNLKTGNYREAERYLKQAVDLAPDYADALYMLGDLFVRRMQIEKAVPLWEKLLEVCPDYKPEVAYFLGAILMETGSRERAIELFNTFLSNPERDRGYDKEVKAALQEAQLKEKLLGNPLDFKPEAVRMISTMEDEYLATISPDQQTIYFTRRSKKINRMDGPAAKVRMVEEFSKAERTTNGQFEKGESMPPPFNQNFNEGGPTITADNTELYFTVCQDLQGYKNCDIYFSEIDGFGEWSVPRSVGDHINLRDAWESQPSVSPNGDALYFTSNRPGGKGGLDLYVCNRTEDRNWSEPQLLSGPVNTNKDEKTPFIHSDSRTLYFSSNGHPGLGGFEIYYSRNVYDTAWGEPQNIGYPINTAEDDLGLFVSLDGRTAYFATNKYNQASGWDIYKFTMPEGARPEQVALLQGSVVDENGEAVTDAVLEIKNLKSKEITRINVDNETGNYARVIRVKPNEDYMITAKKKGSAFASKYVKITEEAPSMAIRAPLQVETLEVGKEYKLNDINFATNSYQIDNVAALVIDEFISFMKENPTITADIQGHTDNVGNSDANLNLSRSRAREVYEYAVRNGISPSRLTHNGFGENRPLETNDTEEGRAKNRRTVFVITSR